MQKGSLCFNIQFFYGQNKKGKEKKKNGKKIDPPPWDLNPGFLNKTFPPKI